MNPSIRATGRPRLEDATPPAVSAFDQAIANAEAQIIRSLPVGADVGFVAHALRSLGDLYARRAVDQRAFWSVQQLQERYGLARKTVERLPIERTKIGKAVRYAAAAVDAYERKCRQEATTDE